MKPHKGLQIIHFTMIVAESISPLNRVFGYWKKNKAKKKKERIHEFPFSSNILQMKNSKNELFVLREVIEGEKAPISLCLYDWLQQSFSPTWSKARTSSPWSRRGPPSRVERGIVDVPLSYKFGQKNSRYGLTLAHLLKLLRGICPTLSPYRWNLKSREEVSKLYFQRQKRGFFLTFSIFFWLSFAGFVQCTKSVVQYDRAMCTWSVRKSRVVFRDKWLSLILHVTKLFFSSCVKDFIWNSSSLAPPFSFSERISFGESSFFATSLRLVWADMR